LYLRFLHPIQQRGHLNFAGLSFSFTAQAGPRARPRWQAAINAASDGDTVRLLSSSPHTEAGITVNKDLVIEGMGRDSTTVQAAAIQATATDRVFLISGGTVEIRDMTIRHGLAPQGGGILNGATLTLSRAALP